MIIRDKPGWKCHTRKNLLCVYFAWKFFICPTCINKKFCVYFTYVLHESTRILYVSIFHMSYMNLREFCVCLIACIFFVCPTRIYKNFDVSILLVNFLYVLHESTRIVYMSILHVPFLYVIQVSTRSCICLFCTSYINIQEFCMCPFCIHIFNMLYMYPQEVVYVYFVCPTWIYKNLICVNFTCVFFVCPTCIHKKLYVLFHMSYINLR